MHFLSKLIIGLTSLALLGFISSWSLASNLATTDGIDHLLEKGGVYSQGTKAVSTSLADSLTEAQISAEVANKLANQSVTASSLQVAARPAIVNLSEWLKAVSFSDLGLSLDMTSIKSQMTRLAKIQGDYDAAFIVTREVPDQIQLVKPGDSESLKPAHNYYQTLANLVRPLGLATLVGLALLLLLAIRLPHKRLAWPGWVLIITGVVGVGLGYVVPFILKATVLSPSAKEAGQFNGLIVGLLSAVLSTATLYWYICSGLGAALLVASTVVARAYHKKKKR